jgi:DNA sulfur modification protein DndB
MKNMTNELTATLNGEKFVQFGKEILITQIPFIFLDTLFEIDELVQRKLDVRKRNQICDFILESVKDDTFYFSSFIFSARKAIQADEEKWTIAPGCKLYILDGQHRASGLKLAIQKLEMQKVQLETEAKSELEIKKVDVMIDRLKRYQITMQVYLDLDQTEERQLFTDINMERRDVHGGLVVKYDKRDEYAMLVQSIVDDVKSLFEIEETTSRLTHNNSALTSLSTMRKCLLAMFEGNLAVKEGDAYYRNINPNQVKETAISFFKIWIDIFPKQMNDRTQYVSGISTIQIALAYTVHTLTKKYKMTYPEAIQSLTIIPHYCSWKKNDPLFSSYYNQETQNLIRFSGRSTIYALTDTFEELIIKEKGAFYAKRQVQ